MKNIMNVRITPYLIFAMFIVYVGFKPVAELLKVTFNMEIRGVDFLMTLFIIAFVFLRVRELFISRHSLWSRIGFAALAATIIIQVMSSPVVEGYGNQSISRYYREFFDTVTRFCILLWIIGGNIDSLYDMGNRKWLKRITYILYFIFIALLFIHKSMYFVDDGPGSGIFGWAEYPSEYYLYYGDIFGLFTLWVVSISKNYWAKLTLWVNGIYWLYLIGSRTSLYCCLIVFAIMLIRQSIKNKKAAACVMACLCIAAYIVYSNIDSIMESNFLSVDNRMMRGVVAAEQDGSFLARQAQLNEGLDDIKRYWLTGRFLREYERTGEPGNYIHNILSYWVEYGIIPFILILSLTALTVVKNSIKFLKYNGDGLVDFVFCAGTFIIAAAFTSRSYEYPYIWFAISMSSRLDECMNKIPVYFPADYVLEMEDAEYEDMHAAKERMGGF